MPDNRVSVKAYRGDAMTLLAFDIDGVLMKDNFVGFSIEIGTPSGSRYFLMNRVNFDGTKEEKHSNESPFQKFRWIHVPGDFHQKLNNPEYGNYKYYVTPRYWDEESGKLEDLDSSLTATAEILVDRFASKNVELAFTRSFLTSQA